MRKESKRDPPEGGAPNVGVARSLFLLYSSWRVVATNVALFGAYYLLFYEAISGSNAGFFLLSIPFYLFVVLVLCSSVLATVAVSYLWITRSARTVTGVAQSPLGLVVGAVVASCSCSLPLVGPLLYFLGLNALEVSGAISFLAVYQGPIIVAIVALDLVSIAYYARLISRSALTARAVGRPSMRS